jgi:large subunit ribosomal protein L5
MTEEEKGVSDLMAYVARMHQYYTQEVVPVLQQRFGYRNVMQVPRLEKVVLNMGLGEAIQNPKLLDAGMEQLAAIAGQKPVITKARKSIAAYKLRTGMSIGVKVTLRKDRMYDFFDRLVNIALPRVRDFRGVTSNAFDGRGNYTLGVEEQVIFPEVDYDKVERIKGLAITVVTSAKTDAEGRELLRLLGMPFRS